VTGAVAETFATPGIGLVTVALFCNTPALFAVTLNSSCLSAPTVTGSFHVQVARWSVFCTQPAEEQEQQQQRQQQ
jgi:hypothetical protein